MRHATWKASCAATAALTLVAAAAEAVEPQSGEAVEPIQLSLERCIELGKNSIEFLAEEEDFILQQLATSLQRHDYGRLWTSTVSAETDSSDTTIEAATLTLAKRLLTGGELELSAGSSGSQANGEDDAYSSSVSLSIEQPLLRGAGRLVAREDLTQAERDLVYAGRDLILFKQEFLVGIVQHYYRLIQQRLQIRNQEEKFESAKALLERTRALKMTGKATPIDVLRAEINLLQAENDLIDARELYKLQLDNFKLDLGLPVEREVELVETTLTFRAIEVELGPNVEAALANRLDLKTAGNAVEDAHRALRIARNNLRGDLGLTARFGYSTESVTSFGDQRPGKPEWSVGLAYEIPLDRASEKTTYRQQLIAYARTLRSANRMRDQVMLDVRKTVRDLRRAEATIRIQERNVEVAEQRLERTAADWELGKITNRDVVEAQNELRDAKNALDQAKVNSIIATLQLQKDIGQLDPEQWRELIK